MTANFRKSALLGFLIFGIAGMLTSCGESTNIQGNSGSSISSCSSLLGVTCVTGRFIDDAAANVDYDCGLPGLGTVRSVTADDGSFACPNGSTATFSLINPDSRSNKITLGSVTISRTAKIYGDSATTPIYFYVTPSHLAGDDSDAGFSNRSINIARLLQTLGDYSTDADPSLPSRHIVISDDDKRQITAATVDSSVDFGLPPDSDPANPGTGTFDYAVKNYLQSLSSASKHQLITKNDAIAALQKGVHSTVAGIYASGPSILVTATQFDPDSGAMIGSSNGNRFVGELWKLVDRDGRMIGSGVYSYGTPAPSSSWYIWSNPEPMELQASGLVHSSSNVPVWPNNGDLTAMKFRLMNGDTDSGKFVTFTNGVMRREAIAGSSNLYSTLFEESATEADLGKWSMDDGSTNYISGGVYTLEHTIPVATWVNPDLWKTSTIDFPLPIVVSVYNSDYDNPACSGGRGCKIADIRMIILRDGNIISDTHHRCGIDPRGGEINLDTLKYKSYAASGSLPAYSGDQEVPLGVVSNILDSLKDASNASITTMTLLAMIPNDTFVINDAVADPSYAEYLRYLQFGSNLGADSLLRIDGSGSNNMQIYGKCSTPIKNQGLCTTLGAVEPGIGTWVNAYTFMRAVKANSTTPNPSNTQALNDNSGGVLVSRLLDKSDPTECKQVP